MCGILGIFNITHNESFNRPKFESALLAMDHRGPDSHKIQEFGKAILGHVRLSIIDLSDENAQPLQVDERYWIIYNGEIYNYLELRDELTRVGYQFRTKGDTEVILKAYQHWGENCVSKFNGMWSFAIFDSKECKFFCSRDRFGIKPFYYSNVDGQLIFSSEIKGIITYFNHLRIPNYSIISNYCRKSIGAQIRDTWFKDIFRLEPAYNMVISSAGIKSYRYWDYPRKVNHDITFDTAVERYREILEDSIKMRMRSDVPVGFTLSSGIDSSSIVSLLKNRYNNNKNTYTASFSETKFHKLEKQNFKHNIEIDESVTVKKLTGDLDLKSNFIEVDNKNYLTDLRKIIWFLESGHGSPAIFPLDRILSEAKKDVTVILEGQGADELLGGYINEVFPIYLIELLKKFQIFKAIKELMTFRKVHSIKMAIMLFVRQSNLNLLKRIYYKFSGMDSFFMPKLSGFSEIKDYPNEPGNFNDSINKYLYKVHTGCLVSLLHYGDAISMSHSLECRQPYMDYRIVEFVFSLPFDFKIHNGMGKYIHRQALQGIVPDYIINNPVKLGFDSPLFELFTSDGEESAETILLSDKCISRGLFSRDAILKAFKEQKEGVKNNSRLLFRLLNVELWFREFIDID